MPNAYPIPERIKTYEKVVKWIKIHKTDKDENVLSLQQITDNANNIRFTLDDGSDASISMVGNPIDRGDYILIQVSVDYSGITSDGNKLRLNSNVLDYSVFTHSHLSSSVTNGVTTSINDTTFSDIHFSMSFKSGDSAPISTDTFTSGSDGHTYYQFGKMPTATLQWKLSGSARLASSSTLSPVYFGMRPGLYLGGTAGHPFPGGIVSPTLPIDDRRYQYTFPLSQSYVQAYDESLPTNPDAEGQHWFDPIYYGDDVPEAVVLTSSIYTDFEISGSVGAQWMISESKWNPHVMGRGGITASYTFTSHSISNLFFSEATYDFLGLSHGQAQLLNLTDNVNNNTSASLTLIPPPSLPIPNFTFELTSSNPLPNDNETIYVTIPPASTTYETAFSISMHHNVSKSSSPLMKLIQELTSSHSPLGVLPEEEFLRFTTINHFSNGNNFGVSASSVMGGLETSVSFSGGYGSINHPGSSSFEVQHPTTPNITFMITGNNPQTSILPNTPTIIYIPYGTSSTSPLVSAVDDNTLKIQNHFNASRSHADYSSSLQYLISNIDTIPTPDSLSFHTTIPGTFGNLYGVQTGSTVVSAVSFSGGIGTDEIYFNNLTWSLHFLNDDEDDAVGQATYNVPTSFTGSHTPSPPYVLFEPTFTSPFQNSNWDVNMNNINDNRLNSFLMNVDYSTDLALPINLQPIRSRVEKKTSTPDSNYTTKRIIDPRYNGSKLSSYDYNFYTPPSASASFKFTPDESGSWGGDISYGKTAVIDKRPIYFAHFVESHPTLEAMGEMEFTIDYLIPIDIEVRENANSKSVPSIGSLPGVIKVNGDGTYQSEVSNIFEKKRKASIDYSQNLNASINWGSLVTQPHTIIQGGARFKGIVGNQQGIFNTAPIPDQKKIWFQYSGSTKYAAQYWSNGLLSRSSFLGTGSNEIYLWGDFHYLSLYMHRNFYDLERGIEYGGDNYRKWVPSSSIGNSGYTDDNEIFTIQRGDQIRILSASGEEDVVFTVTALTPTGSFQPWDWTTYTSSYTCSVFPNPLDYQLQAGSLGAGSGTHYPGYQTPRTSSFFIRRKVDQDNKVLLRVPPVQGTLGNTTPSSDGFLIPNDLSKDQKTRAGHLIATLRGDNLFS